MNCILLSSSLSRPSSASFFLRYPIRAIVPGSVGARNVKWVDRIVASTEESVSTWQRGIQYRGISSNINDFKGLDPTDPHVAGPPVHTLPVQSAITSPAAGTSVDLEDEEVDVKGFAWSGGGSKVVRVDVSADGGKTWHTADLREGRGQESRKVRRVKMEEEVEDYSCMYVSCLASRFISYNIGTLVLESTRH